MAADRLGVPSVIFFVLSAIAPFTVVAGIVTTGYAVTGLIGIPLAFIAIAIVLALFSVGFVAMARHVVNAGAFYAYISQGLSRPLGVGAAWVALLAYNTLQVALYGAIGVAAAPLLRDWFGLDVHWGVIALTAWALVAVLGRQHVDLNGKILAILFCSEITILLIYSFAEVANPANGHITADTLAPGHLFGPGIGALLALAVLGFVGFESAVVFSEEAKDRTRTVPTATYASIAITGGLYALASWAMSVATGPDKIVNASRTLGPELIFQLTDAHLGTAMVDIGRALFVTSVLAALLSFHNTTARYMFALGRERVLPAILGTTSRSGTPRVGSLIQSLIGLIVIITYLAAGWDPLVQLFFWGGTSGALGILTLIAVTSIAVIVFFARHPSEETAWRRITAPILAAFTIAAVLYLVLNNLTTLLGVSPDSPLRWVIPGTYLSIATLGVIWALLLRATRPAVYAGIGLGPRSATAPNRLGVTPHV
ncbi:amino acid transporter [Kibdelosporangium banguiense]|uniref:Amino acid transporter n=1 Tax=Kibdelosporangium banguiense TaxID=1365924 RepID=A0ABS4TXS6_9PSEU|nr:APC family permease [Kibdelosporangium banguiense]MBP2329179.1 amino acid transporter [Kibdelosporangium banguiense]